MKKIKLSQWAKDNDVCYRTAWNKFKEGHFPKSEVSDKGSIFVFVEESKEKPKKDIRGPLNELLGAVKNMCEFLNGGK